MTALVLYGSNNVFRLRLEDGAETEGRIKGKILKGAEGFYNPLAPGDRVSIEKDAKHAGAALITGIVPRRNAYARWNQKGKAPQLLAANIDYVLCVSTAVLPPFRPRFLDRALLQADVAGIEPVIVLNKCDMACEDCDVEERLEDYRRIGYAVMEVSALEGRGMDALKALLEGKTAALVGQSGVGKSSLLNALVPGIALKTAEVSQKFDRGIHTTTMARLIDLPDAPGSYVVDTPGVRRLVPDGIGATELISHLREFSPLEGQCTYGLSCRHVTEPGCKILEAVNAGVIHEDRYESFLRMRDELEGRLPYWEQDQ